MEIRALGGRIRKNTVQGEIPKKDGYINTLDDIGLRIDSKIINITVTEFFICSIYTVTQFVFSYFAA
ncbi:hypothetical protein RclHR1_21150004 [Rhizophagus clarus]|uniref:Uncharacterized protein n=1 Tax=Rhizophagus clarus TaxID=94130 RepID=A0A2Z6QSM9_9GLOM|nr:hypothetical protein RclHR1_21150004 [Rhizophagus clarus]